MGPCHHRRGGYHPCRLRFPRARSEDRDGGYKARGRTCPFPVEDRRCRWASPSWNQRKPEGDQWSQSPPAYLRGSWPETLTGNSFPHPPLREGRELGRPPAAPPLTRWPGSVIEKHKEWPKFPRGGWLFAHKGTHARHETRPPGPERLLGRRMEEGGGAWDPAPMSVLHQALLRRGRNVR